MCPKESLDSAFAGTLTTLYRASLYVISTISSAFSAFYALCFLILALIGFEDTVSGICAEMEGISIFSRTLTEN